MQFNVGVGLLGCGTVGAAVADRLQRERDTLERRAGVRYDLRAIAIRDARKERPSSLRPDLFARDAIRIVDDPHVDVLIECVGGTGDAAELVERALDRGRHVITANKDLIATQGPRLCALAAARGVALRFEAAVASAVPIVRVLDEALAGDEVTSVAGVVSGTCTSILSAMEEGIDYATALSQAQRAGFAEADPSSDVDGADAAHKLAVLMQVAFGLPVISPAIHRTGIAEIARRDIARARMLGQRIRLVTAAVRTVDGALAEVSPMLLPENHVFAQTVGVENVVRIVARDAGALVLRGAGAGGAPAASAMLGDFVSVLRAAAERTYVSRWPRTASVGFGAAVGSLFASLPRSSELPQYPLWDDTLTAGPTAQELLAL